CSRWATADFDFW
nr:immunoglobulin heavy chain junction region [Macaca mulatta]MOY28588.1 immunoglobulin heavy chain junction region [Macaca mulatta]